jgi:hypothetical protein
MSILRRDTRFSMSFPSFHCGQSGSEMVQGLVPEAKVGKTFTISGFENFENSSYPHSNVKPVMM